MAKYSDYKGKLISYKFRGKERYGKLVASDDENLYIEGRTKEEHPFTVPIDEVSYVKVEE